MATLPKSNNLLTYRMQVWQSNSWNTISYGSIPSADSSNDDFFHLDDLSLPDKETMMKEDSDSDVESFVFTRTEDGESYLKFRSQPITAEFFKELRLKAYRTLRQTFHFFGDLPHNIRKSYRSNISECDKSEAKINKKQYKSQGSKASKSFRKKKATSNPQGIEEKTHNELQNKKSPSKELKSENKVKSKRVRFTTNFFTKRFNIRKKRFKKYKSK